MRNCKQSKMDKLHSFCEGSLCLSAGVSLVSGSTPALLVSLATAVLHLINTVIVNRRKKKGNDAE